MTNEEVCERVKACVCGHKKHSEVCKKMRGGGWGKYRRAVYCKCNVLTPKEELGDQTQANKFFARKQVTNALKYGRLVRKSCEVCGEKKTDAHHDDYSKPLKIRWLCSSHHKQWHAKHRKKKWSRFFPVCESCGTTIYAHTAHGLCSGCYHITMYHFPDSTFRYDPIKYQSSRQKAGVK